MSSPDRLPSFFVIGGMRCGTTSLDEYLRQHPDIFLPELKEPSYFNFGFPRLIEDQASYCRLYENALPSQLCGDVSPAYIRNQRAAEAIRELVPEARLIAILRDPVDRVLRCAPNGGASGDPLRAG